MFFSRRLRGLDDDEVYTFLDLLADQVERTDREVARLRSENARLTAENARLGAEVDRLSAEGARQVSTTGDTQPRAAAVMQQAQQVADALVEEAVLRARRLLAEAHAESRG